MLFDVCEKHKQILLNAESIHIATSIKLLVCRIHLFLFFCTFARLHICILIKYQSKTLFSVSYVQIKVASLKECSDARERNTFRNGLEGRGFWARGLGPAGQEDCSVHHVDSREQEDSYGRCGDQDDEDQRGSGRGLQESEETSALSAWW